MKWYKHIADSLDDPFIFELLDKHGADGYLVFFGILEIYAREFKVELSWKLSITLPYLRQKLHRTRNKLITNCLQSISDSGKWDVEIIGERVNIFIPKFRELLDEYTVKKLSKNPQTIGILSGETPKKIQPDRELDKDTNTYSEDFLRFWSLYPNKKEKVEAFKRWNKLNGKRPSLEVLLEAIRKQIEWRKNVKQGEFRPEWKNPATWLNKGCWEDEFKEVKKSW